MEKMLSMRALKQVVDNQHCGCPTVQILEVVPIKNPNTSQERFRVVISDGVFKMHAVLSAQVCDLVRKQVVTPMSVIKILEYVHAPQGKGTVILLSLEKVSQPSKMIGNPVFVERGNGKENVKAQPAPASKPPAPGGPTHHGANQRRPPSSQQSKLFVDKNSIQCKPPAQPPAHPHTTSRNKLLAIASANANSASANTGASHRIFNISELSTDNPSWTIKARVTQKSPIREWQNEKGTGKLFSFDLLDASGEIRATCFHSVVDQLYSVIQIGKVFYISKGAVKAANPKFGLPNATIEIALDSTTVVTPCQDDNSIPKSQYQFIDLPRIASMQKDGLVDVIGVVIEVGPLSTIVTQRSLLSVDLVFWGSAAQEFDENFRGIIAVKGAKISDFNGRTLTMQKSTQVEFEPDITEAYFLRGWKDRGGIQGTIKSLSAKEKQEIITQEGTISDILSSEQDANVMFVVTAKVLLIKHDPPPYYNACVTCNKKVIFSNNAWFCEKCQDALPRCNQRYIISLFAADHTGGFWLSGFDDVGGHIIGFDARALNEIKLHDNKRYEQLFDELQVVPFKFGIKRRVENYKGEQKDRFHVRTATLLDYKEGSRELISEIYKLL